MPRNGQGQYSKPAGTTAEPNTTITSDQFNSTVDDLVTDANAARPVSAGGTGGTSQATAATALGYAIAASSVADNTAGRGLIVGSGGWMGTAASFTDDVDDAVGYTGIWQTRDTDTANTPSVAATGTGILLNLARGADRDTQLWAWHAGNIQCIRQRTATDVFTSWQQIVTIVADEGNITTGYRQFSDGRMEAWTKQVFSSVIATPMLGGFRTPTQPWNFTVPFTAIPNVSANALNLSGISASLNDVNAAQAGIALTSITSQSSATRSFMAFARGRWR